MAGEGTGIRRKPSINQYMRKNKIPHSNSAISTALGLCLFLALSMLYTAAPWTLNTFIGDFEWLFMKKIK
jgi:hypothetical protein